MAKDEGRSKAIKASINADFTEPAKKPEPKVEAPKVEKLTKAEKAQRKIDLNGGTAKPA